MRALALIPFLFVAGCGEAPTENKAAPAAAAFAPGQWELASEVTSFRKTGAGNAGADTPVGTRTTQSLCVGAGHELQTAFFAGDGYRCSYGTYYVRNGRVNLTMGCSREGLDGTITMAAEGTFQANSVEFRRNSNTSLTAGGAVAAETRVTGRRSGDCTPDAGQGEGHNKQG
jgi:Protein of unknown function (DUF3617)